MAMALWLNLDRLLGARFLPVRQMGFYAVALTPRTNIEMVIVRACDVYFAMLSRHADLDERRSWNRRICVVLSSAAMPGLALVVAAAPTIIGILYRPEWAPAKVLFGILTARVMARGLAQVQYEYLLSTGNIRINTAAYIVAAAVQAAILVPMVRSWGVAGLASAGLVSTLAYVTAQTMPMKLRGDVGLLPLVVTSPGAPWAWGPWPSSSASGGGPGPRTADGRCPIESGKRTRTLSSARASGIGHRASIRLRERNSGDAAREVR